VSSAETRVRRRQARDETRRQILDAAERLLRAGSFRELSVESLMAETGHSRTVFYRHFDDLADLILRAGREAIEELYIVERRLAELEGEAEPGASTPEAIAAAVAAYSRHGPLLRVIAEAAAGDEQVAAGYRQIRARFDALTRGALERLPRFSDEAVADAAEVAHALNLMNEAYLLDTFGREPRVSAATAERTLTEVWGAVLG
jgi:AcrR family transcriptional regulator